MTGRYYGEDRIEDFYPPKCCTDMQDAFVKRINEVLGDLETIEDFFIEDTDDPEVIDITIRGRLKEDIARPATNKEDSDYDRAMRGISPCTTSHSTSSQN